MKIATLDTSYSKGQSIPIVLSFLSAIFLNIGLIYFIPIEYSKILKIYQNIKNINEIKKIFLEVSKYIKLEIFDSDFILAKIATQKEKMPPIRLFGLNLLYEIIFYNARAQSMLINYNFSYRDSIDLSGHVDIFNIQIQNE